MKSFFLDRIVSSILRFDMAREELEFRIDRVEIFKIPNKIQPRVTASNETEP